MKQLWNIQRNLGIRKTVEDAKRDEIINPDHNNEDSFAKEIKKDRGNNSENISLHSKNDLQIDQSSESAESAQDNNIQ